MIDLSRRLAQNTYHKKFNPSGIVDLGSAKNELMIDELQTWLARHDDEKDKADYLKYNDTQCSPALPASAAEFMNHFFSPRILLTSSNILAGNGVTALLDTLFFNIADEGEVVLFPTPSYGMFAHDVTTRNGLHLVGVPCDDITEARFHQHIRPGRPQPELINRFETAAAEQRRLGRRVAALLIANPDNPHARCYTSELLRYMVDFCQRESIHFVVDEIYALSGGANFTSVLSLDLRDAAGNVHVLWGMSKDFGMGGCRVGFLATYNERLYQSMRTVSMFTWISAFGGMAATTVLSNPKYVRRRYLPMYHKILNKRRKQLEEFLNANLIRYTTPDAAFFAFVDLSSWLSNVDGDNDKEGEVNLLEYLMARGVFLEPGSAFSAKVPGSFRLNYGTDDVIFKLGLKRLASALKTLEEEDKESFRKEAKASRTSLLCFK